MNVNEYQKLASRTRGDLTGKDALCNWALGLTGEAGEVADLIKKHVFHGHPLDKPKLVKEMGDCFWYLSQMALDLGVSIEEIWEQNIAKLKARYPEGFSTEASINRTEATA